jgi:hypothetical protein
MADGDLHDQIARLEVDIEQLAEGLGRCRKAMLLSKAAMRPEESGYWQRTKNWARLTLVISSTRSTA